MIVFDIYSFSLFDELNFSLQVYYKYRNRAPYEQIFLETYATQPLDVARHSCDPRQWLYANFEPSAFTKLGLGGKRGHADCGQRTADTQIRKFLTCPHFPL